MRALTALALIVLAGPVLAQDDAVEDAVPDDETARGVLEFRSDAGELSTSPPDYLQVQAAGDGDRSLVLLDMSEEAATAFGDLTEASAGLPLSVFLCGAELFTPVVQGRIDGGKVILPVPNPEFGAATVEVLLGNAPCTTIRADDS